MGRDASFLVRMYAVFGPWLGEACIRHVQTHACPLWAAGRCMRPQLVLGELCCVEDRLRYPF